ncbi:MAG TPA: sigma-54 dependent transcriptional regulator [Candidatus Angelobacter sp.]
MGAPRLVVAGKEESELLHIKSLLEAEGYNVELASSQAQVLQHVEQKVPPELIILDMVMEGASGLQVLAQCKKRRPRQKMLMIARTSEANQVVQAIKLGAEDFITKPFPPSRLRDAVCCAAGPATHMAGQIANGLADDSKVIESLDDEHVFLAASPVMKQIRAQVSLVARVDLPVLLLGESGSGKEIIARLIHKMSPRAKGPLQKINCVALPDELLESELFGYEAGEFTGASKSKPGKFELCNRGTVLLDEIGDMTPRLQAKLLQVLQDGEFCRLGGKVNVSVDVRILAATNINVEMAIAGKAFRQDLFYRLNTFTVRVPPLRERREEIPLLLAHFMSSHAAKLKKPPLPLSDKLVQECMRHPWPGNLRELANLVKRYLVLEDELLVIEELRSNREIPGARGNLKNTVDLLREEAESKEIQRALENTNWNRRAAATQLKISYRTLLSKMKQYRLNPPPDEPGGWLRYG